MIDSFSGPYRFLSNFAPTPIVCALGPAATVEHAFQAAKAHDPELAQRVLTAPTPTDAKRMARAMPLRLDWETVKLGMMRELLRLKFAHGSALAAQLLSTGDVLLVEGNTWGDRFWGAVDGQGHNWLGHLLMARRAELRAAGW